MNKKDEENMTTALKAIMIAIPLAIGSSFLFAWFAKLIWNKVFINAVTWANPVTYWMMFWICILVWLIGVKK